MGSFLAYVIYSGIVMLGFYIAYKWFLASENQTRFNRVVLLVIYLLSFTAWPVVDMIKNIGSDNETNVSRLVDIALPQADAVEEDRAAMMMAVLILVYVLGVVIVAARAIFAHCRIARIISGGEHHEYGRYVLVLVDDDRVAPFSWMRYIVMNRNDYMSAGDFIAAHESRHLDGRHWIDLLVAEVTIIIEWFNPVAWLMREELLTVHEYQADMGVIDAGYEAKAYQLLLIRKSVGIRMGSLANSLNHSKLKKRIAMMMQAPASKGRRLKAAMLLPAICISVLALESPVGLSFASGLCHAGLSNVVPTAQGGAGRTIADDMRLQTVDNMVIASDDEHALMGQADDIVVHVYGQDEDTKHFKYDGFPAVFVDGVLYDYERMADIDPNKIESISVEKSTEEYPNGVIRIKLK